MFKRFVVSGTKKDDILTGTDRLDIMFGKNGDDVLEGRGGWDFLFGGKGNDKLFGGDGNDWLFGDKGKDQLFGGDGNDKLFGGKGSDFLDGGAGSDYIFGDKGNDTFNFTLSENGGAKDYYDGGKGFDTLQLSLTSAEYDAAKAEIGEFEALLADGGKDFYFESLGLKVRNFEDLKVVEVGGGNAPPVADGDSFTLNEETETVLPVHYTDADGDPLTVIVTQPEHGAVAVNPDGTLSYTPATDYFGLDEFTYQVDDGTALSNVATVSLTINSVNDAPTAVDDDVTASAVQQKISVAVLGLSDDPTTRNNTTHAAAAAQLDPTKFSAQAISFTAVADWDASDWSAFLDPSQLDVVVIGDSGFGDYDTGGPAGMFQALSNFVEAGGGVVTTGWFARALPLINQSIADDPVRAFADDITPIASSLQHNFAGAGWGVPGGEFVSISDSSHPISGGLSSLELTVRFAWELAGSLDAPETGATPLATGIPTNAAAPSLPAIAYDSAVGAGRSVFLGGTYYVGSTDSRHFTESSEVDAVYRTDDLDAIFERAVAWAAGARGGSATFESTQLLDKDFDVDNAWEELFVLAVDAQSVNNRAVAFDSDTGNINYALTAEDVAALQAGGSITDSFDYTLSDPAGATSVASVNLTINGLDSIFG